MTTKSVGCIAGSGKSFSKVLPRYDYYGEQLQSILPVDEYGVSIQLRCGGKKTKWMTLNNESKIALQKFMETIC